MGAIQRPTTREHAGDRRPRWNLLQRPLLTQRHADRIGPVLAQDALLAQARARTQDALLHLGRGAVPGAAGFVVSEVHLIEAFAARLGDPVGHRAHAEAEPTGYRSHASPRAHRPDQFAAAFLN